MCGSFLITHDYSRPLGYSDFFLTFLFGTSLWCGLSDACSARADVITLLSFTVFLCSFIICRKVGPVWPMYVCGQLLHEIWYTTPALSSSEM